MAEQREQQQQPIADDRRSIARFDSAITRIENITYSVLRAHQQETNKCKQLTESQA